MNPSSMIVKTLPLTTNSLYRGRRYMTEKGKANKDAMGWEIKQAWANKPFLKCPIRLKIDLYWPDMRRHDVDNIKALLDSMTGIVYEDDSEIKELWIAKHHDKKNPRVEIEVL
jgi:crossover junction endodeoxyribonuclease RusA